MPRQLDPDKVIDTLVTLNRRIEERFPQAGLAALCRDLVAFARRAAQRAVGITRPNWGLRLLTLLILAAGIAALAYLVASLSMGQGDLSAVDIFPALEAAANLLLLFGAAIFFLWRLEERLKRRQVLSDLYELRSIAHIVDMHQLTKDPTAILVSGPATASSPRRAMTEFELVRYLEYCAEMHALSGKLAALYAQNSRDPAVLEAVKDVESLATDLGRKIWQKITVLQRETPRAVAAG